MAASPRLRKFVLITHVATSVGWIGAAATYMVLTIVILFDKDPVALRSALVAMRPLTWFILLPIGLLSLIVGIVQSLVTPYGLVRHYWVLFKLALTIISATILTQYTLELGKYSDIAANPASTQKAILGLGDPGHLLHAGLGLLVLMVTLVLSIYKPRGTTKYGERKRLEQLRSSRDRKQGAPSLSA
jgi:hypothetical protein